MTRVERTAQKKGSKAQQADGDARRKRQLPPREEALELLDKMLLIRHFEERAQEMYMKAKIGGFLHLAVGEEATVVGTTSALEPQDYLLSTYREHGPVLARGVVGVPSIAVGKHVFWGDDRLSEAARALM